jgi:hypothetical protein
VFDVNVRFCLPTSYSDLQESLSEGNPDEANLGMDDDFDTTPSASTPKRGDWRSDVLSMIEMPHSTWVQSRHMAMVMTVLGPTSIWSLLLDNTGKRNMVVFCRRLRCTKMKIICGFQSGRWRRRR